MLRLRLQTLKIKWILSQDHHWRESGAAVDFMDTRCILTTTRVKYEAQKSRAEGCKRRFENVTIDDPAKLQWCLLETEKRCWQVVVKLFGDNFDFEI